MNRVIKKDTTGKIFCINGSSQAGTYLLRIQLQQPMSIQFGQFGGGRVIYLEPEEYVYIGSALSQRGSTTLGNRIQRHADRSPPMQPHIIRKDFQTFCTEIGLNFTLSPSPKTPFWNIDHLTNLLEAEIIGIILVRAPIALENLWSEFLEAQPYTEIFAKGLGANDTEGHTHIQKAEMTDNTWSELPYILPLAPKNE